MDKSRRRWMWLSLAVVVTLVGAWVGVQLKWVHDRHEMLLVLEKHGASYRTSDDEPRSPALAPWPIKLFGATAVTEISLPVRPDPVIRDRAKRLFPEATVDEGWSWIPAPTP